MANANYDSLESKLVGQLEAATNPVDIEKISAALKNIAEAKKADSEHDNAAKGGTLEHVKSLAATVVPFLSVLALVATVISQEDQSSATRDANEDTQWREALASISNDLKQSNTEAASYDAIARLKPFFRSQRYKGDARDFAILMLGKFTDEVIFTDLFTAAYSNPGLRDLNELARINRQLVLTREQINAELDKMANAAAPPQAEQQPPPPMPPRPGMVAPPRPPKEVLEHLVSVVETELQIVDVTIANILRARSSGDSAAYDLNGVWFIGTDLHNANFHNVDLSNAQFWSSNLKGASFAGERYLNSFNFPDSAWWEASLLEADALQQLMKNAYPDYFNEKGQDSQGKSYWNDAPTKDAYAADVRRLCAVARIACPQSAVIVGPDKPQQ